MARTTLRIPIPIHQPDELLLLCQNISEKHAADGVNSPLDAAMMATFDDNLAQATALRTDARKLRATGRSKLAQSRTTLGLGRRQNAKTPGTLYNLVLLARDRLDIAHRQNPEASSQWGFGVKMGRARGRVTVRYRIPVGHHDELLALADDIWEKHQALGAGSPLLSLNMATFDAQRQLARAQRAEGLEAYRQAKSKLAAANVLLGRARHQNARTAGTLYYDVLLIRDMLKIDHQQNPKALTAWGFEVITGQALARQPRGEVDIRVMSTEAGHPPIAGAQVREQIAGELVGITDARGHLLDKRRPLGPARYELHAPGFRPWVVQHIVKKARTTLAVQLRPET